MSVHTYTGRFTRCAIEFFRVQRTGVVFRSILLNGQGKGRTSIAALDPGYGHCANSVRHPSTSFVRVWTATWSLNSRGRMMFRPCWPNSKGSLTSGRGFCFRSKTFNSWWQSSCLPPLRRGSGSICTYELISIFVFRSTSGFRMVLEDNDILWDRSTARWITKLIA